MNFSMGMNQHLLYGIRYTIYFWDEYPFDILGYFGIFWDIFVVYILVYFFGDESPFDIFPSPHQHHPMARTLHVRPEGRGSKHGKALMIL